MSPGVTFSRNPQHVTPDRATYLWWLSFVDPAKAAPRHEQVPGGPGFLGVVIVESTNLIHATARAWELGCNPGGEVEGFGPLPLDGIPRSYWNRLLTKDEAEAIPDPWAGGP